jgi:hypothetical protein
VCSGHPGLPAGARPGTDHDCVPGRSSVMPLFARELCRPCQGNGLCDTGPHVAVRGWPVPAWLRRTRLWRVVYRRSSPSVRARLTASPRLCTPSRWYRRSARSFAADREMPSLSAMTEKGTG